MSLELIYENIMLLEYSEQQAIQLLYNSKVVKNKGFTRQDLNGLITRLQSYIPEWESVISDIPQTNINKTYLDKTKQSVVDSNILYQLVFWLIKNDPALINIWDGVGPADLEDRLYIYKTYLITKSYFKEINKKNKALFNINGMRTYADFISSVREMFDITQGEGTNANLSKESLGKWYSNPNVKFFMKSGIFTCFETKTFEGTKDFIYNIFNYDRSKNYEYGDIEKGYHPYCTGTYEKFWDQYSKGNSRYKQYWIFRYWPYGEKIPTPPPTETDIGFVGKKYLHSMQDSYNDYLDRDDERVFDDVITPELEDILKSIPYLEINEYNIDKLTDDDIIDYIASIKGDLGMVNAHSVVDRVGRILYEKEPEKLIDAIGDYMEKTGNIPIFAYPWVETKIKDRSLGRLEKSITKYIKSSGDVTSLTRLYIRTILRNPDDPRFDELLDSLCEYISKHGVATSGYLYSWMSDRIEGFGEISEKIQDAIFEYVKRTGKFVPSFASEWFLEKDQEGNIPQKFMDVVYQHLFSANTDGSEYGTFLSEQLLQENPPQKLKNAIFMYIDTKDRVPRWANKWAESVLYGEDDDDKQKIFRVMAHYIKTVGVTPIFGVKWITERTSNGEDLPKVIENSIYDYMKEHGSLPMGKIIPSDWYKKKLYENPPIKLVNAVTSLSMWMNNYLPPFFSEWVRDNEDKLQEWHKSRFKGSRDFKEFWSKR